VRLLKAVRKTTVLGSTLVASWLVALPASAATWYVSPIGTNTSGCVSRDATCSLDSAAHGAVAGDTVILMDGLYKTRLYVTNSGTASAWITFKADECSTPIIEGPGVAPDADDKETGVGSATATYLRFDGIVSRGWNTGFGNGWTGNQTPDSNGYWEIQNCIGDMNGRTGFTFFSAPGVSLKRSISAHNGSSTLHSWSSGVTLYASPEGVIEGNVSFENMDAQKHTDGSGFIADRSSHRARFVNNLGFRNGGSCLRLTLSEGVTFINNTCYHDAQDVDSMGPNDPNEVYFSNAPSVMSTITDISFSNNALVALGTVAGMKATNYTPTSGWSNNVTAVGAVTLFTGAEATSPDFTIAANEASLVGMGAAMGAPTTDLGFDPKCVVKRAPTMIGMMAKGSWWEHSIDYEYIKSIGGVAKCFNPKARAGTPDIGGYANGPVTTAMANTCTPATPGTGVVSAGGAPSAGGTTSAAGTTSAGGAPASGGTTQTLAGASSAGTPPSNGAGGSGAESNVAAPATDPNGSCGCRVAGGPSDSARFAGFALLGVGLLSWRRRARG
jgi:MYXO-CTERM domain-containing protein